MDSLWPPHDNKTWTWNPRSSNKHRPSEVRTVQKSRLSFKVKTTINRHRAIIQKGNETLLVIQLGERYHDWIKECLKRDRFVAHYWFARIFEYQHEIGVHKAITKLTIGSRIDGDDPVWPFSATISLSPKNYAKLYKGITGHEIQTIRTAQS